MDLLLNIIRVRRRGYEDITAHCVQNIDLDDDCSITCTGYERNWKYKFFLYCVCGLLIGIPYLFLRWYPQFEVHYFWKKCTLENAQILLIRDSSGRYSLHRIIELIESESDVSLEPLRFFIYKLQRFMWCKERVQFQQIRGLANGVNTLANILTLTGGLPLDEKQQKLKVHGKNRIDVDVKSYWRLLIDEALNPFYIFEAFSVTLWIFDEYHYYAAFIIVLSVVSIYSSLSQTKKQHVILKQQIASSGSKEIVVVHTSDTGRCEELWERLVPGDVIEIPPNGCLMMCDALLISGICIANESSLTGESAPVTKIPPSNCVDEIYKPNSLHMRHTLYCGTQVLQTRYYENNKVIAVVVGTGCNTAKGQLVRSILYPKPVAFDFMVESIKFIFILFGVASLAMMYSTYLYILRGASLETLLLRTLDIITIVVPPTLPAAMTAGTVYSQKRLRKQGIFCTSPPRILVSGKTTLVCFDKTGTLTEEGMDLWGVLPSPVYDSRYQHLSSSSSQPPPLTDDGIINNVKDLDEKSIVKSALAVCHSLTVIDGKICGDPLDLVMFKATEWELEEPGEDNAKFDLLNPTVVRPKRKVKWKEATTSEASVEDTDDSFLDYEVPYEIGLIRLFPFTSSAQNMSIICRTLGARNMTVFSKGAPEKILHLCNVNSVPTDISNTLSRFTIAGYRVIALAYKEMPKTFTWLQAQRVTRDQIENELNFLGLLLIQNNIKPQSEPVIKQLQMAKIKCIMATGDNIMTAVSVSRDCGILSPKYHVVLLSVNTSSSVPEIELQSLSGRENEKLDIKDPLVQIVMDGNAWYLIRCHFPELIDVVTVKAVVFARMSPQQKTTLIETLQGLDYFVTMCGDGANDCGALKAAHVGISLSRTEASIVAPFTCQEGNVSCVVELIKEGRCALVTSFGLFNYMAMYSLIQFISVILLYSIGAEMGTVEFLYVDLVLTTSLVMSMGTTGPSDTLITRQPITSLVSLRNVAPLLLQILVALLFQLIALNLVQWQPWYVPVTPAKEDEEVVLCWENTAVYSISCFQYLILAFVYSRGKHHRQAFYKNWLMLVLFTLLTIFTAVLALYPADYLSTFFEMEVWTPNEAYFRIWLLVLPAIHFFISYLIELIFNERIGSILFRNLRRRKIPKKKYRVIEEQSESGLITYSV